jgi:hypothetical protein
MRDAISVFAICGCKVKVAKFACHQRTNLTKLFVPFGIELIEFGHCSNPLIFGGSTPSAVWSFPLTLNNHSGMRVPTSAGASKRIGGKLGLPPSIPFTCAGTVAHVSRRFAKIAKRGTDAQTSRFREVLGGAALFETSRARMFQTK